jgi:hypothetical protein
VHRSQQLAVMFLLGAFLVGGTLGFTVDRVVGNRLLARTAETHGTLDAFSEELSLSPSQRAAVDSILDERHRIIDSLIAPVRPRMEVARETARRQIAARLDDAQRLKFESYLERKRKESGSHD